MSNFTLIVLSLFIATSLNFHIIVEDTATHRKGTIYGKVRIIHHERDNKPAFIIIGPYLLHHNGEPPLTLSDVDIMHQLEDGLFRFEPEFMQPQFENNTHYLQLLKYKSKKNPNWIYRFYFQSQLHQLVTQIKNFVDLHQIEPHVDLFQQIPEEIKQQLLNEHLEAMKAAHKVQNDDQL